MDPQVTWDMLLQEWKDGNWIDVVELSKALLEWLDKDGFPPETMGVQRLGAEWNRTVVLAACTFALHRANNVLDSPNSIPSAAAFTLTCYGCNNEGPEAYGEAIAEGWKHLRYTPAGTSENFLGHCPHCQVANA